jgi:BirA family transcriptional regulator, biotin operon repressor / biotin---[acetyl-CoA-carboxylase] ligase
VPDPPSGAAPSIVRLATVDSTQRVAFELAERGAADRTVVVADTQTAGRGRQGRRWHDEPGDSLLMSIVVRPRLRVPDLAKLSPTTAVAVAEAVGAVAGLDARVKWPNDVLVGGRKLAGILLESRILCDPVVVVGIGVNLCQRAFPGPLAATATSVQREGGRSAEPAAMLEAVLTAFDAWRARLEGEGFAPVRARWLALADTIGRRVTVGESSGLAVDLDGDGALVLEGARGRRAVVAGELTEARGD